MQNKMAQISLIILEMGGKNYSKGEVFLDNRHTKYYNFTFLCELF